MNRIAKTSNSPDELNSGQDSGNAILGKLETLFNAGELRHAFSNYKSSDLNTNSTLAESIHDYTLCENVNQVISFYPHRAKTKKLYAIKQCFAKITASIIQLLLIRVCYYYYYYYYSVMEFVLTYAHVGETAEYACVPLS